MRRRAALASAVFAAVGLLQNPVDVSTRGPQVGAVVRDFTLTDQTGQTRSVQAAAGPKGTMVVFFRSADW